MNPVPPTDVTETIHRIERYEPGSRAWQFHATAPRMTAAEAVDIADGLNRRSRVDKFRAVRKTAANSVEVLTTNI